MSFKFNPITGKLDLVNKSISVISKTYAELSAMVTANEIIVGQYYLMTDFHTRYINDYRVELKVGPYDFATVTPAEYASIIEPIVLIGKTSNSFEKNVFSTLFPDDIIEYDFSDTAETVTHDHNPLGSCDYYYNNLIRYEGNLYTPAIWNTFYATGKEDITDTAIYKFVCAESDNSRPGLITRRKNKNGNDYPHDFRHIKFARFVPTGKLINNLYDYSAGTTQIPNYSDRSEEFNLDFTGIVPATLSGLYFTLNDRTTNFYVWFNDLDGTSVDPVIPDYTPIQVDYYSTTQTITDVVGLMVTAINGASFVATQTGDVLFIDVVSQGELVTIETAGDTGAVLTVTRTGYDPIPKNLYIESGIIYVCYAPTTQQTIGESVDVAFVRVLALNEPMPFHFTVSLIDADATLEADFNTFTEHYSIDWAGVEDSDNVRSIDNYFSDFNKVSDTIPQRYANNVFFRYDANSRFGNNYFGYGSTNLTFIDGCNSNNFPRGLTNSILWCSFDNNTALKSAQRLIQTNIFTAFSDNYSFDNMSSLIVGAEYSRNRGRINNSIMGSGVNNITALGELSGSIIGSGSENDTIASGFGNNPIYGTLKNCTIGKNYQGNEVPFGKTIDTINIEDNVANCIFNNMLRCKIPLGLDGYIFTDGLTDKLDIRKDANGILWNVYIGTNGQLISETI